MAGKRRRQTSDSKLQAPKRPARAKEAESAPVNGAFLVVGIGASAGGLEALERFFAAAPADSGMAFVVIQHLSPDFKSLMDELLARVTPMPIVRVTDVSDILPNTVYILPPRKEMVVSDGRLVAVDKPTDQALSLPINTFFRSIARELVHRSVAIVLSGTGSDGSIGIQDVHEVGGFVLAQSEETAKFEGMPKSAVSTGCVDLVLAPEEMPAALLKYAANPSDLLSGKACLAAQKEPLTGVPAVLAQLRESYDIDFTLYKAATIERRIDRRVSLGSTGIFQDYIDLVLKDAKELDKLYKDLLIGVTRFFRDGEAFQIIADQIIPAILESVPERTEIRVWVPGCATGEEPYSLAILFLEACAKAKRAPNIKIFATDMHRDSLQTAAEGCYSAEQLDSIVPSELRSRYFFEDSNGRYRVVPPLRTLLIFSQHNILKDPPFTRVDLISCRNLLIYFESAAQNRVLATFHFALKTHGHLFLGPSEGTGNIEAEFEVVNNQWKIFRKLRDIRLPIDMRNSRSPMRHLSIAAGNTDKPQAIAMSHVYDELMKRYIPSAVLVNESRQILHIFGNAARYLKPGAGQMTIDLVSLVQGDLRIAIASALQRAHRDKTSAEFKGIRVHDDSGEHLVSVRVEAVIGPNKDTPYYMVFLQEIEASTVVVEHQEEHFELSEEARNRVLALEQELQHSRETLQATIEELETSGEELQASNEELLASNEELQSTNEELHSVNEELYSVNSEYEQKIKELNQLTADWRNLLRSTEIGVVFLAEDYTIRLFSQRATDVFNLLPQDIGRDIRHITSRIPNDDFIDVVRCVITDRRPLESQLLCPNGTTFLRKVLPYDGSAAGAPGTVITLVDISDVASAQRALRDSENRFRSMLQALGEALLLLERTGVVLSCNDEAVRLFSMRAEQIIGSRLLHPPQSLLLDEDGLPYFDQRSPIHSMLTSEIRLRGAVLGIRRDGFADVWVIANAEPIPSHCDDGTSAVLLSLTDIKTLRNAEQEVKIAAVALESTEGIMVTDAEGNILRVNRAFTDITGYSAAEAIGKKPSILHSGNHDDAFYRQMWKQLLTDMSWRGEVCNRRKDGSLYPQWLTIAAVTGSKGQVTHYVATFSDITEQKEAEEKIRDMAYFDPLTGLPNRRLMSDRLQQAVATSARTGQYGAVFLLDLDNFKTINDVHGHAAGDKLLIEVATRLKNVTRECDTVSRLGGDEFVLVIENLGSDEYIAGTHAEKAAGKLRMALSEPYLLTLNELPDRYESSASCGICLFCGEGNSPEDLLKHADGALYQAKNAGRNASCFFTDATQEEINRGAQLEAGLRSALSEGHFQIYFQPQVNGTQKVRSAEALIRWAPPGRDVVTPSDFVPFAERNGMILPIGNWVLESACKVLRTWSTDPEFRQLRLAVNISARQFHERMFCEGVSSVIKRHGIDPDKLELELTESVVIGDINQAIVKMKNLRSIGVHLAMDDFGSGYSSLSYLKRLPFERLKIAQEFVRDIITDPDDAIIVRTILAMGEALRLEVTAEGVETEAQHRFLSEQGCRTFQGYLFGRPMPIEQFTQFVSDRA